MNTVVDKKKQEELGVKIKSAREKLGLTQEEAAKKTSISTTYFAMVERGEANLSYDKIRNILNLLKMKASEIPL